MVEIISFSNRDPSDQRLLQRFVDFHWDHYKDEPRYVPLLDYEYLGSKLLGITGFLENRNLFFEHGESRFFLALRDGKVVGRCNAFTNRNHNEHWNDKVGFFGHFEAIDDAVVTKALLTASEGWLKEQGMTTVRGPQNFPINEATPGVLIDGFDSRPVVYYHYNHPYYHDLILGAGYEPKLKVKSWEVPFPGNTIEQNLGPICRRIVEKNNVSFERWGERKKSVRKEEMFSIYNDAWNDNFGFVPFSRKELFKIIDDMQLIFDPELFIFAYVNGEPAAFFGAVPNIFEGLNLKKNRKRSELLRAARLVLSLRKISGVRLGYLGVKKKFRNLGLDAVLIWKQGQLVDAQGYGYVDVGWVLETNKPTIKITERCGGRPSKTYQLFEKAL